MRTMPAFPIKKISPRAVGILKPGADYILKIFSTTPRYLNVIGMEMEPRTYSALGLLNAIAMTSGVFGILFVLSVIQSSVASFIGFSLISSGAILIFSIFYWMTYPFLLARRKAELIEKDLLFALRDISVETSGGLSLKDAIDSVSQGYGELSVEMRKISEDIGLGTPIEDALEKSLESNISPIYRSVMIRVIDGIRSGVDISNLLAVVISNLGEDLRNKVKKYGQEINTWITLYLVIGIVLPSMGLTLMIMLSSFSGIVLTTTSFYIITMLLIFFHASSLSMLKSRRPVVEI